MNEAQIKRIQNIPYLGADSPYQMDAWIPHGVDNPPACILIHGGGWTTGDKADDREQNMASCLCSEGYAVFSVNYHMARYELGPYQGRRICDAWPLCMANCMDAIAFLRVHAADFEIDADRIGVLGSSAGGHLALLLGAVPQHFLAEHRVFPQISCRVSCSVSFYGVPDLTLFGGSLLMPRPFEESREEWMRASASGYLEHAPSPVLLVHGDQDETVPMRCSEEYYNQLKAHGYEAEFIRVSGGKHSFDFSALTQEQLHQLMCFLGKWLKEEE